MSKRITMNKVIANAANLFGDMRQLTKDEIKTRNNMYDNMVKEDQELLERFVNGGCITHEDLSAKESPINYKDQELLERFVNGGCITHEDLED